MIGKKKRGLVPGSKAGQADATVPDRRAFVSGFPMDGAIACDALARLFARAEVEAEDLAEFQFKPGVHPDWMRDRENRESDPACAVAEIEEIAGMILERVREWAVQSPEAGRGRWALAFLEAIEAGRTAKRVPAL